MSMMATASPAIGGAASGAASVVGGVDTTGLAEAALVDVVDRGDVFWQRDSFGWSWHSMARCSECWLRASAMPVPHSWYATNSRINTPVVMKVLPMPRSTL